MDAETATESELVVPFLRSCLKESLTPVFGKVTGEIPKWLQGTLIRVGSGLLNIGPDRFQHVFDGMALLHRFSIQEGSITYQNQFLKSDTYKKNIGTNRIVVSEFGTPAAPDPCKTIFQKFASLFTPGDFTDNDLINIIKFSDEFYASSETNYMWKISPRNLDALEKVNISNFVGVQTATAHPHEDRDGTVYNMGSSFGAKSTYNIIKFPPRENKESSIFAGGSVVARIPISRFLSPCYYHSFGMSQNYFVFVEQPLYMSIPKFMWQHITSTGFADSLQWLPQNLVRFFVVHRKHGLVSSTQYVAKPFMVFHHINTYEENNHLIVDMCCYEDGEIMKSLYIKALEEYAKNPQTSSAPFTTKAKRFVLPLIVPTLEQVGDDNIVKLADTEAKAFIQTDGTVLCQPEVYASSWKPELPRINYELSNGLKYKYFYAVAQHTENPETQLIKVNMVDRTTLNWTENDAIPSEPVFVADPNSTEEDEGVLLASLLFKHDAKRVALLILDAKTMQEIARSEFTTDSSVPADFHGIFIKHS